MRNLRNIKHTAIDFGVDATPLTATAWDASDDSLICIFGPTEASPLLSLKRFASDAYVPDQAVAIASWDAPSPNPDLATDSIIDLHCFPDTRTLVLVLAGGDIVVVREEPQNGEDPIEIVGSVDAGISAAAWSPDEELLAIATKADTMLFMTRSFESTATVTLSPEDVKVSHHVSVGWGKAETQFKGRGVKALRDPTVPEHVDEGTLSPLDDSKVTISWRGDGQYVAVNSIIDVEPKRRVIRVYSREGVLDSVSEAVNGLEGALSWKPSGQLIAGVQRRDDRIDVVFFERNGLRHGDFSLRLSTEEMSAIGTSIDLKWNIDSAVLAVTMRDRVQLWTMGNYHYYLKQEILFNHHSDEQAVVRTVWHQEKALQIACFNRRSFRSLSYTTYVAHGSLSPPYDLGLIAVVDGSSIKLTPLRTADVPPPMSFDEVDVGGNVIDVAFDQQSKTIAVLLPDRVKMLKCDYGTKPPKMAQVYDTLTFAVGGTENDGTPLPRQIALSPDGEVVILSGLFNQRYSQTALYENENREPTIHWTERALMALFAHSDHERLCCEDFNGVLYEGYVDDDGEFAFPFDVFTLPSPCLQTQLWHASSGAIAFGLTVGGLLHIHSALQKLRIPGCTSFLVTAQHLIYTTSQHLLKFVHLHDAELQIPADEPEKDERCRNIERGAKLVTVMPSAYSLVLQMPRGNLETIYPRALVLAGIRQRIQERDYKKAFLVCRTHRVDMNILHDYAPEQFKKDIELFVKQVQKTEYIDVFLSSLTEENVAQTIYKETLQSRTDEPLATEIQDKPAGANDQMPKQKSKINTVCELFLGVLQSKSSTHLQNIITAHVCKSPPDLEAGLRLVSELRQRQEEEQLEQAVEHICFLADVNQLYDTALGLYDLDVTLLVAQQSQKDPREYLPYLQELNEMEPLRKRFNIDNDLKRYQKALSHLHELGVFDELKAFMAKHELHTTAMELYRYDNARMRELMQLYADYLSSRNRYKDAGIGYEFVQDHTSAYEAYRAASMWRECLANATLVPVSDGELTTLATDLAEALEEAKDYVAAATVYKDYLNNLQNSVKQLCKGYRFAEAMRQVTLSKQAELLKELVDPGLIEGSASMTELLAEMKSQLNAQVPRLRELRQKKADDPMAFLDGADGADGDVPDNISLAPTDASTSGGTFMTRYTNRSMGTLATNATRQTSKNRRREERKRARGKKGTVYEEEYLVNSVARLIERLNVVGEDVSRLVEGLMRRAMRERAMAVENAMVEVVGACSGCMEEVFGNAEEADKAQHAVLESETRPWGGQGVLWDALSASQMQVAPVLKPYGRLALLS